MTTLDKVIKKHAELTEKWRAAYAVFTGHPESNELDYESLCVGWCVANGLSVDEAVEFYRSMIPLELF